MHDKAVTLQTAILKSDRDKLKHIQEKHGHESVGETIGWFIELFEEMEKRGVDLP